MKPTLSKPFRGSEWSKWDLHIHTPLSICNDYGGDTDKIWGDFFNALEALPAEVKVIGINDYYFIEGYEKVLAYKQKGGLKNIEKIFPILEFRIDTFASASENRFQKINLHILFDLDESKAKQQVKEIKDEFLGHIKLSKHHSTEKLTIENLAKYSSDKSLQTGFNELIPSTDEVLDLLKTDKWKDRTFVLLGYPEWNNLNKGIQLKSEKNHLYKIADAFFTANESEPANKKEEVLHMQGNYKPLFHSGDIHNFKKLKLPDYKCFTWVKAEHSFEGLKQAYLECEFRIKLQNDPPKEPLHQIRDINFTFPDDTKIDGKVFCLSGKFSLHFSPYFTCLIGGRGIGKSTTLNLIARKLDPRTQLTEDTNKLIRSIDVPSGNPLDYISIDDDEDEKRIDFLSQNEIHKFALNQNGFTEAIYKRLLQLGDADELESKLEALNLSRNKTKKQIDNLIFLKQNTESLEKNRKELNTKEGILKSINDPEFKRLNEEVAKLLRELNDIAVSKVEYQNLSEYLSSVSAEYEKKEEVGNDYDRAFNKLYDKLIDLAEKEDSIDFSKIQARAKEISLLHKGKQSQLTQFLEKNKISKEDLKELQGANRMVIDLKHSISSLEKERTQLTEKTALFDNSEISKLEADYQESIQKQLIPIVKSLSSESEHIEKIELIYDFDKEEADNAYIQALMSQYKDLGSRPDYLKKYIIPLDIRSIKTSKEFIKKIEEQKLDAKTAQSIIAVASVEDDFKIMKLLADYSYSDLEKYKIIKVTYGGRQLEMTSFGQRCTAVMMVMLLLGNNPIIIDEPETHLDSSLIASYLVKIIKDKKINRQIIFATHNANFVVNGDAEIVYLLKHDDKNKTYFTPTTIENKKYRSDLMLLEGGKDAFKARTDKYESRRNS